MMAHMLQGVPPWLLTLAQLGLIVHISAGSVAILSGAAALSLRKGERLHRAFGNVFFVAMLTMSVMAASLAGLLVLRGHVTQWPNIFAGVFTFYMVATAWATVRRAAGTIGRFEVGALLAAVAIAAVALFGLLPLAMSPAGQRDGVPVAAPIIFTAVAALAAALDLRLVLRGGISGVPRIARHLWRMCLGLFVATGSFFLGQQKVMPAFMHGSPVLLVLGVAPLALMIFWLIRIRLAPLGGRRGLSRRAGLAAPAPSA